MQLIRRRQGVRRQPDAPTRSASTAARSPSRAATARTATARVEENLDLFARMRAGEFADGAHVLRAKIDMASPNINMRDPVLYRIRHAPHHRTGDAWCIYPMYDFAHCALGRDRGHHALALHARVRGPPAALRLGARRAADVPSQPRQIEFARLNLTYTVMSKRKLLAARRASGHVARLGRPAHADDRRACGAAATRRRRSATSASASASPRATASVDVAHARARRPRGPEPARAARDGGAAAAARS